MAPFLAPGALASASLDGHHLLAECAAATALIGGETLAPGQRDGAMHCLGFVDGITRIAAIGHLLRPGSQMFCPPPEGIATEDGVAVLVAYLEEFPERRGAQAITLAAAAFMRAWPCAPAHWPDGPPPVGLEDRWRPPGVTTSN